MSTQPSVLILKFCVLRPNTLVLRRREAASKDASSTRRPGRPFWSILRDAWLRLAPQDEVVLRRVSRRSLLIGRTSKLGR